MAAAARDRGSVMGASWGQPPCLLGSSGVAPVDSDGSRRPSLRDARPVGFDGKEGVDGSSPSEGLGKPLRTAVVCFSERGPSGIDPADLDVVELHDASASAELILLEQLGLAEPGHAAELLRDHETSLDGRIPTNVGGGLLSRGHATRRHRLRAARRARRPVARPLRRTPGARRPPRPRTQRRRPPRGEEAAAVVTVLERATPTPARPAPAGPDGLARRRAAA